MALACLVFFVPGPGAAAAARTPAHHATVAPLPADTTPLPQQVVDAGAKTTKGTTSTTSSSPSAGSSSGSIVRMLGGLVIVLGVIYGVYWLLKTYAKSKRGDGTSADDRLAVLGTTTLAPNRSLHLVRVGQEVLLLGSAEQSVTPIRTYSVDELRKLGIDVDELHFAGGGRGGAGGQAGLLETLKRMTAR